jgi:hypothetical protein
MEEKNNKRYAKKENYLQRYIVAINTIKRLKKQKDNINEKMEELRRINCTPAGQRITGMPKAHNHKDLSNYIEELDEFEREIQCLNQLMDKKRVGAAKVCTQIWQAIEKMDTEDYKDVLSDRYILRMSWSDIAEKHGYSRSGMYYIKLKALDEFKIPN